MKHFFLFYLFYMGLFYALFEIKAIVNIVDIATAHVEFTMFFVSPLINLMGIEHYMNGINIHLPHNILAIKFGCNGLEAIVVLFSGILAYPNVKLKERLVWLLGGYIVLTVINNIRIAFLAYVIEFYNSWFELMHVYVTSSIMIFLAFLIFLVYVNRYSSQQQ